MQAAGVDNLCGLFFAFMGHFRDVPKMMFWILKWWGGVTRGEGAGEGFFLRPEGTRAGACWERR